MSDESTKGSDQTEVSFNKVELPSKDESKKPDDGSDQGLISDSDTVDELIKKIDEGIEKTGVADVMAALEPTLQILESAAGRSHIDSDYDNDFVSDGTERPETYSEESRVFLEEIRRMCWRILVNAKRCLAKNEELVATGKIGFDMSPLKQIFQRVSGLDEDMNDFVAPGGFIFGKMSKVSTCSDSGVKMSDESRKGSDQADVSLNKVELPSEDESKKPDVPVFQDLSDVRNLENVMQYLCNKGKMNVMLDQVRNHFAVDLLFSYCNGYYSFRADDLKSLEQCRIRLESALDRWEYICPCLRKFVKDVEYLEQMDRSWLAVRMTKSEMEFWHENLKLMKAIRDRFCSSMNDIVRDIMVNLEAYNSIQADLTWSLIHFLDATLVWLR